ncbi:glycosyltransferase family 2 protein [Roseateles sp.]|uniref:glycosyltransferase family 2 protein n=1 Tax=Roseateles sp. TaxID=1971397 RepID=UPI0039EC8B46
MDKPLWSVVIPLYNKQDFIEDTVSSVLAQTDADYEVVVVDDGSTDEGPSRVVALGDARIRLIQQPNGGVSRARNRGIREARGAWVVLLDADDLLHPEALKAYREMLGQHPDAKVLGGRELRLSHVNGEIERLCWTALPSPLPVRQVDNLPAAFLKAGLPFSSSSIAIRLDHLSSLETWFPEGESMGEDLDLWLRLAEQGGIVCTSVAIVVYRVGLADSLTGAYRNLMLLPVWQRLRERARSGGMRPALVRDSLRLAAEMEITLARRLGRAGRYAQAWTHLSHAHEAMAGHRWWVTAVALLLRHQKLLAR